MPLLKWVKVSWKVDKGLLIAIAIEVALAVAMVVATLSMLINTK